MSEAAIPASPAERTGCLPALRQGSGGFTLLEVMVALAIVSVALVSLLTLANRSITTHARLQRLTQATLLAQQKMATTEVDARFGRLVRNRQEGVFPEPYSAYRWRLDFADTPLPSIKAVTVTVVWGEEKNHESVDLTSLLF
jgi:general secretion pathway protein I